jgi:hypothetical protein
MGGFANPARSTTDFLRHQLAQIPLLSFMDGEDEGPDISATCEIFDPKTGTWTNTTALNSPRVMGSGLLLPDGRVVLGGGVNAFDTDSELGTSPPLEIFDPNTEKWTSCAFISEKAKSVITQLSDNTILQLNYTYGSPIRAWIFDPKTQKWSRHPEYDCQAGIEDYDPYGVTLPSGELAVEGKATEIYNPKTKSWTTIPWADMPNSCYQEVALNDGRLIRLGEMVADLSRNSFVLDLKKQAWSALPPMNTPRGGSSMTVLASGKVLVAGGYTASCELYDPASNTWSMTGSLHLARTDHSAVLLHDGRVLVMGGHDGAYHTGGDLLATCEIYDPTTGLWIQL